MFPEGLQKKEVTKEEKQKVHMCNTFVWINNT